MYYFVDFRRVHEGEGWEPDLPEDSGFLLMADPPDAKWGIYRCGWLEEEIERDWPVIPVDEQLLRMLKSGEHYPPALAKARNEIEKRYRSETCDKATFGAEYAAAIERHLEAQRSANYVLAKAVTDETGYLRKGAYYWVLSYTRPQTGPAFVEWVSGDYFVYRNLAEDFELSEDDKRRLAGTHGEE